MNLTATQLSRRRFLAGSASVAVMPGCLIRAAESNASTSPAASNTTDAKGLTVYELGPQIWIRWNNRLVTCYRAHPTQKYPYLFPLSGPVSGISLTAETCLPYPHHRSLFFGCDRVNDGNYWQEGFEQGQIVSSGPKLGQCSPQSVEILDTCTWRKPGQTALMKDQRRITVSIASDRLHLVDWEIQWTALVPVTIQKTNHSLFALRAAPDLTPDGGGRLINAEGLSGEKATFGQKSAWCDFSGRRTGFTNQLTEGIAILDHPSNPWSPCPWFTRDYGFISPTPLNFVTDPWKLEAGKTVNLRYRVVLHAGDPREADLPGILNRWTKS
jgi:hypothetical protein